jgi:transcription elongation factor GreA
MAAPRDVPITPEGLADIRRELDQLVRVRRPDIVARIKAAREHGDLSENFEYHSARNEQSFIETRILELEGIVKNHVLIQAPGSAPETVQLASTVTLVEEGAPTETYRIVGPAEADPGAGRVCYASAMGKALLGHRVGDDVDVHTPTGASYTVRIVSIE